MNLVKISLMGNVILLPKIAFIIHCQPIYEFVFSVFLMLFGWNNNIECPNNFTYITYECNITAISITCNSNSNSKNLVSFFILLRQIYSRARIASFEEGVVVILINYSITVGKRVVFSSHFRVISSKYTSVIA